MAARNEQGREFSTQEIFQQVVGLTDQLATANARIVALENAAGSAPFREQREQFVKGGIFDKVLNLPEKLARSVDFREWSEDYH